MANADHTSHPAPAERREGRRFIPLGPASQHCKLPHDATLYLNTNAPANALYDAAEYRLKSVIELLSALHLGESEHQSLSGVSRALLLLVSDAQSLYQADHEQRGRRR
ncbi:hypothetical protein NK553_04095 [Pseudomonas sp. ZM23]|uniref:DUF3077 domain-containing protein n=1 Tax=Pseudomonas triclosanedens TaxID=2961893 RepID=A0ABY6ZV55_9PSED|nr:hypothetical protein [Pseudomonas triclosanedens]MCP8463123.1 hypothetical protein [Pseudomonas triclosanedens]MCP8469818.1 hypothetical protein [Pseudomonas triclosanedens]MCP8473924.1 hypothetical protein [Pseudomonas triclosanedens]WAI48676.1 hypothetical protein OU419_23405 [Pseudomonas triclosanedens]